MIGSQLRVYVDGVPIEYSPFVRGAADAQVALFEGFELYRALTPIALGSATLGGVLQLLTDTTPSPFARASYQLGSFGTHRATGNAVGRLTLACEVSNLSAAEVYDSYGLQRPGRMFHVKVLGEL